MGLFSRISLSANKVYTLYYNPRRVFLMIMNDTESIVYISEDPVNIELNGIPIYPFEVLVFDRGDGDKVEGPYYLFCKNDVSIRVYEGVV